MLDLSKQKAFEQKVESALDVATPKNGWNPAALYNACRDYMRGSYAKKIAQMMEQVGKIDKDLLGLGGDLDNTLKSLKGVKHAQSELQGLVDDLKADAQSSRAKLNVCAAELRKTLGVRGRSFQSLSLEEKKAKVAEIINKMDKTDTEKVKNIFRRMKNAVEESKESLCDAHAVVSISEGFGKALRSERESRGLDLSIKEVATAFQGAISSALTGFTASVAALRASKTRGDNLDIDLTKAAEAAVKDFATKLDSDVAVARAEPLLKQIADLETMLTPGTKPSLVDVDDGRIIVKFPKEILNKLRARFEAEIPATLRAEVASKLAILKPGSPATPAEKQAASDLIKEKFAGMDEKLQQMKKLVDEVTEECVSVFDSKIKTSETSKSGKVTHKLIPNVLATRPLETYLPKLKKQVEAEMIADCESPADIATETSKIDSKFRAIRGSLESAIETKLETLIADTSISVTDLGAKCKEAVKKGIDLLQEGNLKARFPADQGPAARAKALDELENALKAAFK